MNDRDIRFEEVRRLGVLFDFVVVVVFVLVGRHSHHHATNLSGVLRTLWPFAVALVVATLAHQRVKGFGGPIRAGLFVGTITVAVAMVLRVVSGQGTAAAFIVVALVFLDGCMILWRLLAQRFWPASGAGRAPK